MFTQMHVMCGHGFRNYDDCNFYLIDVSTYSVVQNQRDQQLLYIAFWDVEKLGDERNSDTGVGLYNVEDHLCTDVLQQVFYIVADEGIIIDCPPA